MNATIVSLIAVTVGFGLLVAWVYWPSRRSKLEELGRIPLDGDDTVDSKNKMEQAKDE